MIYMKNTFIMIGMSLLWYICGRLRKENDREGWLKIRNKRFHDLFFFGGYWEYRPCDIVLAVVAEIGFLVGMISMVMPITDQTRFLLLVGFNGILIISIPLLFYFGR